MTSHLIKFSFRSLRSQGGYVAINVMGLAIGMACSLMIALFLIHELSYDTYHEHKDRIYRLGLHGIMSGQELRNAYIAPPAGPAMATEFPEVENFLRMEIWDETIIQVGEKYFTEAHFALVDSSFFDFFSIPLIRGNKHTALTEPNSVVLTETAAARIFGEDDPMDQLIRAGNMPNHFRVTGIMEDIPKNTHFSVGMIGSLTSSQQASSNMWLNNNYLTYLKLYPGSDPFVVEGRFEDLIMKYVGPQVRQFLGISVEDFLAMGNRYNYFLQPLTKIHLDPSVEHHHKPANDPKYLWIFGGIGLLILLIASINFTNLSTAQAGRRAKEVGMKKVVGSSRSMLITQFIAETVLLAFLALILAVALVELSLPFFNNILSLDLSLSYLTTWYIVPGMILLAVFVGLLAGSYPAFYLSSFHPAMVLKGKSSGKSYSRLRFGLTVMQFAISIMLISGSVIMHRQLAFMTNKDLGFDKENILVVRRAYVLGGQVNSFKTELQAIPGVLSVSSSTAIPGRSNSTMGYTIRGRQDESYLITTFWVDYDFPETFGMNMAEGRFFDPDMPTDQHACIVNQSTVKNYHLEDPYETRIVAPGSEPGDALPVIGVIEDFHYESLKHTITPAMLRFKHDHIHWGYVSIRYQGDMLRKVLKETEQIWDSFTASEPMLHYFLDEDFNRLYREEEQNARLSVIFTILAIIIASMGLYGLIAFSLQQRIREIGVRKTFGASVTDIWYLVCKDVMALLAVATVVAWPLVYWVGGNWLHNFHYRIGMQASDFILGFVIAVMIALTTISYRVIRTASMNPSLSLRYE
jgi:putative ABC transport system permease protein